MRGHLDCGDGCASSMRRDRVAQAPPSRTAVIVLRFYEDMPLAEIAEQLGMPLGTVKSTLHRALSKLKETLQ